MNDEEIRKLLEESRTIAVVGLSSNSARPSHGIARYLQGRGYRIVPVNPKEDEVLGETAYPDLESLPDSPDLVVVFRRPEAVPDVVRSAVAVGARAVWLQPGAESSEGVDIAEEAGLPIVSGPCIMVTHSRLVPKS